MALVLEFWKDYAQLRNEDPMGLILSFHFQIINKDGANKLTKKGTGQDLLELC